MIAKLTAAVLATIIVGVIMALSVGAQQTFLAPSLGAAAFTQVMSPDQPVASPYSIGVGQLLGLASGIIAVHFVGAQLVPTMATGHPLVWTRFDAVVLAILLTAILKQIYGALTPSAGATALVVASGSEPPDLLGVVHLLVGIALVTALGEVARRFMLRLHAARS